MKDMYSNRLMKTKKLQQNNLIAWIKKGGREVSKPDFLKVVKRAAQQQRSAPAAPVKVKR